MPQNQAEQRKINCFGIVFAIFICLALFFLLFFGKVVSDLKSLKTQKPVAVVVMDSAEPVAPEPKIIEKKREVKIKPIVRVKPMQTVEPAVVEMIKDISFQEVGTSEEDDVSEKVLDFIADGAEKLENPSVEIKESEEVQADLKEKEVFVAVVIDDMGISSSRTKQIVDIKAPLTSSFLTYGAHLQEFLNAALAAGHEIMMHVPMEPKGEADVAPDMLKISMSDEEIEREFLNMIDKFEGVEVRGVNNHMGSLFTENEDKLDVVMKILKQKNMFFLDSRTSENTKGEDVAEIEGVIHGRRDVFLDNENEASYIRGQFEKLEKIALKKGFAVGICHPKKATIEVLKDWAESLKDKNIELVHLSRLLELKAQKK